MTAAVAVRGDRRLRHGAGVAAGIVLPIVAEVWFLGKYAAEAASWHWYIHFFAGATVALVAMTWWSWRRRRTVPFPLAWVLLAHFFAAAPDLVIPENIPHQPWQEVFVGHLASHYMPGRELSWLVVFAAALAGYLLTLARRTTPPPVGAPGAEPSRAGAAGAFIGQHGQ